MPTTIKTNKKTQKNKQHKHKSNRKFFTVSARLAAQRTRWVRLWLKPRHSYDDLRIETPPAAAPWSRGPSRCAHPKAIIIKLNQNKRIGGKRRKGTASDIHMPLTYTQRHKMHKASKSHTTSYPVHSAHEYRTKVLHIDGAHLWSPPPPASEIHPLHP